MIDLVEKSRLKSEAEICRPIHKSPKKYKRKAYDGLNCMVVRTRGLDEIARGLK